MGSEMCIRDRLKAVIRPEDTIVNDQTAAGFFDIGTKREQYFEYTLTGVTNQTVTFPQPFGAEPLFVVIQKDNEGANNGNNDISVNYTTATATTIDINPDDGQNAAGQKVRIHAVGLAP